MTAQRITKNYSKMPDKSQHYSTASQRIETPAGATKSRGPSGPRPISGLVNGPDPNSGGYSPVPKMFWNLKGTPSRMEKSLASSVAPNSTFMFTPTISLI